MHESIERFIDLAARPLTKAGVERDLACGEMMDRLAHASPGAGDDSLEDAARRLGARKPAALWKTATAFLTTLALLGALLSLAVPGLQREWRLASGPHSGLRQETFTARVTAGMSLEEELFLMRNFGLISAYVRQVWLDEAWETSPDDPGLYEERALAMIEGSGRLPPDHEKIWRRIDPGNGLWDTFDKRSIEKIHKSWNVHPDQGEGARKTWSHIPAATARRIEMLGECRDLAETMERIYFHNAQRRTDPMIDLLERVQSRLGEAAKKGDWRAWENHMRDWEKLVTRPADFGAGLSRIERLTHDMETMASRLEGLAGYFKQPDWEQRVKDLAEPWRKVSVGFPPELHRQAGTYMRTVGGASLRPPSADELKPLRMAEHALMDRFMALAGALLFAVFALLAGLEALRRPVGALRLAAGLSPLWRRIDTAWLLGLGIALPLAWHAAITRGTPLGCRDIGLMEWDAMPALQQAGGSALFAALMLIQTARWRWAKRGAFFGMRPSALWPGWVLAAMAALFVPASGAVRYLASGQEEVLVFGSSFAGLLLLWLLWMISAQLVMPRTSSLPGMLVCRTLWPVFASGSLLALLVLAPHFKAEERRQIAADSLLKPDPSGEKPTLLEAEIMRDLLRRVQGDALPD